MKYDLAVLGGGPGGYMAALTGSRLGASVALIEENDLGGTCLNYGCIPTKALLQTVRLYREMKRAHTFGIHVSDVSLDIREVLCRKSEVVQRLRGDLEMLLHNHGISILSGQGVVKDNSCIHVWKNGEESMVQADKIILATGSISTIPSIQGISMEEIITSNEALDLKEAPQELIIIGGGAIGCEFATIFSALGSRVILLEMMERCLPDEEPEVSYLIEEALKEQGVVIHTSVMVNEFYKKEGAPVVSVKKDGGIQEFSAQTILLSVGRSPNPRGLEELDLEHSGDFVAVNGFLETNRLGVYAIGDLIGGPMLAHKSMHEGMVAAQNALGRRKKANLMAVPHCIYTLPEVASVGMKEKEAREKGYRVRCGTFSFKGNGKAVVMDEVDGFVKIVTDETYNEILGVHIVGPQATEMIAESTLAIKMEATTEEIIETIHAHPTLSETLMEAAIAVSPTLD